MRYELVGLFVIGAAAAGVAGPVGRVAGEAARPAVVRQGQFPYTEYDGRFIFARIYHMSGGGLRRGFGGGSRGEPPWQHDYPAAEQNFTQILRELTYVHPYIEGGNVFELDDPRLMKFPIAYMSEPGWWQVEQKDAEALRNYLLKGGFIIFDDFAGRDMYNLVEQMKRVLPELDFMPLDGSESIFDSFFKIDPATINLIYRGQAATWYGIFEDNDRSKRLLAVAGHNGDLGEFWEYSATGFFPVDMSNEAYKVGVNYIVYAMTH